ncbi:patatin-like phospholipase family protein [Conexibacter sp. JD483]|uniref:patatin-like phospholipase family protein n=1 Tax=unclassified Conexibacter TaxID=2627773 RepID=UPI002727A1B4|nr:MULTISPECIES: patatin-like phospholipase family protein [unclassified Conexibacter]MDO8185774.1 patatin-like phospholipase family protein [Conexibacter sp. CPCC 205706]MDO8199151.1 patatin-like phospholipase family protein [Conexibacter sp. CPCC 205762]MDR9369904.1 patatin-like phospholipase family protein [Conexibacter sp. JD483]
MIAQPDVLVLGAGGALAQRWMEGVLAGLADGASLDFAAVEQTIGTSAGAIVAAGLLAGREPARPAREPGADGAGRGANAATAGADPADRGATDANHGANDANAGADADDAEAGADVARRGRARRLLGALPAGAGKVARAAGGPLAPYALAATRPPGALVRAGVLGRLETPTATLDELGARIARDGLRFDGRLRIVCVERESGRRVVFGAPGAPNATVAEAVQASCSVPWLYRPVTIEGHEYVDGGLWSPTSIDVAPAARETRVLVLNPTGSTGGDAAPHGVVRTTSRSAAALEALTLRRRGARVTVVAPDRVAASALSGGWIGHEPDAPAEQALAAGYRQGLALARGD